MALVSEVLGDKKDTCRHIVLASLAEMGHPIAVCVHRLDTLASMGVTVHSVAENINTYRQPFLGKIWRSLRDVPHAEHEFKDYGSGRPPFGYKKVGRQLYDIPEEHVIIAEMIQAFRQGENVDSIARRANANGHRTRTGGKWYPTQVERIVKAPENLRYWSEEL
jgi:DNA invertase Pin-like site-specific DNA recombinase